MFSKGLPFFLVINVTIYGLSNCSLFHGTIKKPHHSIIHGDDLSDNTSDALIPAKVFIDSRTRHRRGIVLIDEDFDKLPDVSVRQSWSGENTVSDITELLKESEKDSLLDEGSGSTIEKDSTIEFSITPGELQITKEKPKLTSLFETTIEGSGDDIVTSKPTESEPTESIKNDFFSSCSNFTCDAHEITILPGFAESLSEDSTLILTCSSMNFSVGDSLQWYKSNGSDNLQLEASIVKNQLQFAIPKVKLQDSGKYLCIKLSKQSCCHKQLVVAVYKKPNYKFHLLIVGLVTLVSLFICLLLGIHRRYKLKKVKKQLKTQIPLNEFLL